MKKVKQFLLLSATTFSLFVSTANAQKDAKFQEDRKAILSMVGCYHVTFDYAETFASDTNYQFHDRYHAGATEYVFVLEDSKNKISLQHLLVIDSSMTIKHWRQDWLYENADVYAYNYDNEWKNVQAKNVKGQWTQKVYQVDDGLRYESNGTWNHVDGRHFWESEGAAPLPRREHTKRSDYNVMYRRNHVEITKNGWYLEQDNDKVLRTEKGDSVLVAEKGMERFDAGNYDCSTAIEWWNKNKDFWSDVRTVWNELIGKKQVVKMKPNPGDAEIYFKLIKVMKDSTPENRKEKIKEILASYLI